MEHQIVIDVVKGGFVLTYPAPDLNGVLTVWTREVFTSQRKLTQKIKEVLEAVSTTPDDTKGD